jgi:hypothetical protein
MYVARAPRPAWHTEIAATACKTPAMIDPIRHYKLLATALPAEEERIRTAYLYLWARPLTGSGNHHRGIYLPRNQ